MQAAWILGAGANAAPAPSKKAIREVLRDPKRGAGHIFLERTSPWEYEGLLLLAPREIDHWIVGPDPWESRQWYGAFHWNERRNEWEFK